MGKFSIFLPFEPVQYEEVIPFASLVRTGAAYRLWQGQTTRSEPHQSFAFVAGAGCAVPVGIGVTLMPFRHPFEAALQAQSLAVATGHPVVVGYGPGGSALQRRVLGAPYRSPRGAAGEYVSLVRELLTGAHIEREGRYFSYSGRLGTLAAAPIEIGLGVLRPAMARLAGEVADVVITWLTPISYLEEVLIPAVRAGAEAVGRKAPRIVSIVPIASSVRGRDLPEIAFTTTRAHLRQPHYLDMLRRAGIDLGAGDPVSSAEALLAGRVFIGGGLEKIEEELGAYHQAGVDEVALHLTGLCDRFGRSVALAEFETILAKVSA